MRIRRSLGLCIGFAGAVAVGHPALASFHLMQIEQVIGGVNGDVNAQAIQLRQRFAGQNFVSQARLVVRDATGFNPVTVLDMTTDNCISNNNMLCNGTAGRRIRQRGGLRLEHGADPLPLGQAAVEP